MAETIAAFGIAVNTMQFIDFSSKILSTSYKIYRSGQGITEEHLSLENLTNDFRNISYDLQRSVREGHNPHNISQNDIQLRQLAEKCAVLCQDLLTALDRLKAPERPSKWDSIRAALRAVWKESKIKEVQGCLNDFRQEILLRVLSGLR